MIERKYIVIGVHAPIYSKRLELMCESLFLNEKDALAYIDSKKYVMSCENLVYESIPAMIVLPLDISEED